jgi:uncharacterized protein (TIGR02246 family)
MLPIVSPATAVSRFGLAWCAALALASGVAAADTAAETAAKIEAAIRAASRNYLLALRGGDAERIAACWTADARFVDAAGNVRRARDMVREGFGPSAAKTEGAPPRAELSTEGEAAAMPTALRLLGPDAALETTDLDEPSSEGKSGAGVMALWVRRDGKWLLDYVRETAPAAPPEEVDAAPLAALAWMEGTWETVGEGPRARLEVAFVDEGRYLLQRFTAQLPGGEVRGEQRLAWDGEAQRIRSWLFRSDGGFLEGIWRQEGDAWVSEQAGVLPGGVTMTAVNLWVREGEDRCWFKTHEARVDESPTNELVLEFQRVR